MHRIRFIALIISVVILVGYAKTYKISTVNWAGWAFLDVAEQKGFWKELGGDVEVVHFEDGAIMHDKMITGGVDLSMNMMPYAVWMNDNVKAVSVLMESNWSNGGDKIIVRDVEAFKKGLGPKVIGVYLSGYALEFFLEQYLNAHGQSLSNYSVVKMQPSELVKQFNAGRLQALVIFEPLASKVIEEGKGEVVATTADYHGVIREGLYTFNERLRTYPKEDVVNILRGIIRALVWIGDEKNKKEFYDILNTHTFFHQEEPYPDAVLDQMLQEVKVHSSVEMLSQQNSIELPLYFEKVLKFLSAQKWRTEKATDGNMLFLSYLKEALEQEKQK